MAGRGPMQPFPRFATPTEDMRDPQPPVDLDDRRLVEAYAKERDEDSFRALYRRHTDVIYGVVFRLLGEPSDADDVVQETWLIAARRLPEFRWESRLRTWLTAIAVNCARNRIRRRRTHEGDGPGEVTELPAPPPIDHAIDPIDMARAIDSLPNGYREVLVLHDVHGHTHDEVAEILGIATGTSKSQLARARGALRRWLGRAGGERNDVKRSQ